MASLLIVDDDCDLTDALKDLFEMQGHCAAVAATGAEALHLMTAENFDLILLDWQLPDMDGIAVCTQYRQCGGLSQVLMLTGMRDGESRQAGKSAGADDFLTKPFTVDQLLKCIERLRSTSTGT